MSNETIPSAADIARGLKRLNLAQLHALAKASSVPFATLSKVRSGETMNPGIETVRKFLPHIEVPSDAAPEQEQNSVNAQAQQAQAATNVVATEQPNA